MEIVLTLQNREFSMGSFDHALRNGIQFSVPKIYFEKFDQNKIK